MTQLQLVRAVARATGESVKTIQRRGFSPMSLRSRQPAHRRHGPNRIKRSTAAQLARTEPR